MKHIGKTARKLSLLAAVAAAALLADLSTGPSVGAGASLGFSRSAVFGVRRARRAGNENERQNERQPPERCESHLRRVSDFSSGPCGAMAGSRATRGRRRVRSHPDTDAIPVAWL